MSLYKVSKALLISSINLDLIALFCLYTPEILHYRSHITQIFESSDSRQIVIISLIISNISVNVCLEIY